MSDCGGEPDVPTPDPWSRDTLGPQLLIRIPVSEAVLADAGDSLEALAEEVARSAADLARAWVFEHARAAADRRVPREPNPHKDFRRA